MTQTNSTPENLNQPATKADVKTLENQINGLEKKVGGFEENLRMSDQKHQNNVERLALELTTMNQKIDDGFQKLLDDQIGKRDEIMTSNNIVVKKLNTFINEQAATKVGYDRVNGEIERLKVFATKVSDKVGVEYR